MDDTGVIQPEAPSLQSPDVFDNEVIEPELESVKQEERELADLQAHPGWFEFRKRLVAEITALRTSHISEISNLPLEEVGKMVVVNTLAADKLQNMLDLVDNTAVSVQEDLNAQRTAKEAKK